MLQHLGQCAADLLQHRYKRDLSHYLSQRKDWGATFDDEVYGTVQLGFLSSLILGQPEFKRLGGLRQLGCSYKVFGNASHTRLQHSRGVAHLSFKWGLVLAQQQRKEGHPSHTWLTPFDLELIEVAGLCHDLGHGPFSHVFEAFIVPMLGIKGWKHEDLSSLLLHHMLTRLMSGLGPPRESDQLLQQVHGAVTDLITAQHTSGYWRGKDWVLMIVASMMDADKLDYLLRDMLRADASSLTDLQQELFTQEADGALHPPDFSRLIANSRLVDGHICFAAADQPLLQQVFRARYLMHQHVYQHAAVKGYELMVAFVLKLAAPLLDLEWLRNHQRLCTASAAEVQQFINCFRALNDSLLDEARRRAVHQDLQRALNILDRHDCDDVFHCVAEVDDPQGCMAGGKVFQQPEGAETAIIAAVSALGYSHSIPGLAAGDIHVVNVDYHHCNKDEDPLPRLQLYAEVNGHKQRVQRGWSAGQQPDTFRTRQVRVYLLKQCSDQELTQYSHTLQAALQVVLQQAAAAAADVAPAAAGLSLGAAAVQAAVVAAAGDSMDEDEEEEEEEMIATQDLGLTAPAAASVAVDAGRLLVGVSDPASFDMQSSQAAEEAHLIQTPAAAGPAVGSWPYQDTPNSHVPALTPYIMNAPAAAAAAWRQEQREQQQVPFSQPVDACARQQSCSSFPPAAPLAPAESAASAALAGAAAAVVIADDGDGAAAAVVIADDPEAVKQDVQAADAAARANAKRQFAAIFDGHKEPAIQRAKKPAHNSRSTARKKR